MRIAAAGLVALTLAAACERPPSSDRGQPVVTESQRTPPAAASGDDAVETVKVTDHLYMLVGKGGNVGVLVGDDAVLMVDDKFAPNAPAIKAAVAAVGGDKPLRYLVNTHHHGDHTGGNPAFAGATIIAHDNVRKHLAANDMAAAGLPVITFDHATTIHLAGETVRIVHAPHGHTDGDSILFFENNHAVQTGDNFFNGRFPFIDLGDGGQPEALLTNVTKLLDQVDDQTKIIPGHGPLATRADLETFRVMLTECIDLVKKQKAAGKTLAQIHKAGVPAKYAGWGSGFVDDKRWLETLYNGLRD